jgi:hypothetical protein
MSSAQQKEFIKPGPPSGDAFWTVGEGFRDAADACFEKIQGGTYTGQIVYPCCFLYFRGIELFLKSALIDRGFSADEVRSASHRITQLLTLIERLGTLYEFGISDDEAAFLRDHSDDYSSKWYEYPDRLHSFYPEPERSKAICDKLHKLTSQRPF